MATLPPPLGFSLVLGTLALAYLAYLYWDSNPEKAQGAVGRVFTFVFRLFSWAGMMICIPGLMIPHALAAMVHVTVRCLQGKPYKVVLDLE